MTLNKEKWHGKEKLEKKGMPVPPADACSKGAYFTDFAYPSIAFSQLSDLKNAFT